MCLGQLIAQIPVLQRPQFGQRLVLGEQRVLIDPADARGVRTDLRCDALGHAAGGKVEVFQYPGPRPINVRAVFKNDVDEGRAEEREAANHFGLRH